jgi:hypothetical protein
MATNRLEISYEGQPVRVQCVADRVVPFSLIAAKGRSRDGFAEIEGWDQAGVCRLRADPNVSL